MKIITKETAPAIVLIGFLLWSIVAYFFDEISIPLYVWTSFLLLAFGILFFVPGFFKDNNRRFERPDKTAGIRDRKSDDAQLQNCEHRLRT